MRGNPRRLLDERRNRSSERDQQERESSELRERIAAQWAELRATRRAMDSYDPVIAAGPSNLKRAQVPYGVDLAAAWGWRFLVISAAAALILYLLNFFIVVVLPLVIALLVAALVMPVVTRLVRVGMPRKLAALLVVLLGLGLIALLGTFVGNQVSTGVDDLSGQVDSGLGQIRDWLHNGFLHVSDKQLSSALDSAQEQLKQIGSEAASRLTEVGTTLGHVVAAIFIVLFATYFFLADGPMIWAWLVRLFPRAGRRQAHTSGLVAWSSLTQFVRATVLVAATDAAGIMIGAAILQVPFVSAIGVLVFVGAFVPMIGATVSGIVAVLVALVSQGPFTALLMLGVVVAVQQLEAHILQPFLMGRFVSVHPLGVIVAIAVGVLVAGIAGALVAVPLAASLNAVVQHLANYTDVGEDPHEAAEDDPEAPPPTPKSELREDGSDPHAEVEETAEDPA